MMTGGRQLRGTVEGDSSPDVIIPQLIHLYERGRFPFDRTVSTFYTPSRTSIRPSPTPSTVRVSKPCSCMPA